MPPKRAKLYTQRQLNAAVRAVQQQAPAQNQNAFHGAAVQMMAAVPDKIDLGSVNMHPHQKNF